MVFRIFGFGDRKYPKEKSKEKAGLSGLKERVAFDGFLRSEGEVLKKEKTKGSDRALQPDGERHPVYRGQLRIEELEPKISP